MGHHIDVRVHVQSVTELNLEIDALRKAFVYRCLLFYETRMMKIRITSDFLRSLAYLLV